MTDSPDAHLFEELPSGSGICNDSDEGGKGKGKDGADGAAEHWAKMARIARAGGKDDMRSDVEHRGKGGAAAEVWVTRGVVPAPSATNVLAKEQQAQLDAQLVTATTIKSSETEESASETELDRQLLAAVADQVDGRPQLKPTSKAPPTSIKPQAKQRNTKDIWRKAANALATTQEEKDQVDKDFPIEWYNKRKQDCKEAAEILNRKIEAAAEIAKAATVAKTQRQAAFRMRVVTLKRKKEAVKAGAIKHKANAKTATKKGRVPPWRQKRAEGEPRPLLVPKVRKKMTPAPPTCPPPMGTRLRNHNAYNTATKEHTPHFFKVLQETEAFKARSHAKHADWVMIQGWTEADVEAALLDWAAVEWPPWPDNYSVSG
jgi:hypothetical protein